MRLDSLCRVSTRGAPHRDVLRRTACCLAPEGAPRPAPRFRWGCRRAISAIPGRGSWSTLVLAPVRPRFGAQRPHPCGCGGSSLFIGVSGAAVSTSPGEILVEQKAQRSSLARPAAPQADLPSAVTFDSRPDTRRSADHGKREGDLRHRCRARTGPGRDFAGVRGRHVAHDNRTAPTSARPRVHNRQPSWGTPRLRLATDRAPETSSAVSDHVRD